MKVKGWLPSPKNNIKRVLDISKLLEVLQDFNYNFATRNYGGCKADSYIRMMKEGWEEIKKLQAQPSFA